MMNDLAASDDSSKYPRCLQSWWPAVASSWILIRVGSRSDRTDADGIVCRESSDVDDRTRTAAVFADGIGFRSSVLALERGWLGKPFSGDLCEFVIAL